MRRSATLIGVVLILLSAVAPAVGASAVPATAEPAGEPAATQTAASAEPAVRQSLNCSFPLTVTDATGHELTIEEEPQSVVTLSASAAQTLWEVGAKEKVVGVSMFASYLDGADSREVVMSGQPATVNVEKVVGMDPDLVLAPNVVPSDTVTQLRDAGIDVYKFEMATSVETIYEKTKLMGELVGACEGAAERVAAMEDRVNTVEQAVDGEENVSVFYGASAGFTAGPDSFIGNIVAKAGGHNIAAEANASRAYFRMSAEFIAEQNPEYVVVSVAPDKLDEDPRSFVPADSVVRNTTAWEEGNIVVVNTNYLSQPAPRVVVPLTEMATAFHGEAYAAANATTTSSTTAETTAAATDSTTATTDGGTSTGAGTDGGTPGFGIAVAVLAVLGAALVARR